ncbi:phosphatase PAP2 family protein [Oerskovia sp. Sa1BUA8]|uniref:Phosphatase PAP2 family protein n=1 Tax=Oerskovia douganii TaxID=2762210 RepID=A0A9D5YZP0_9CELL|nr:phosphatase PAP2 family protein [Oerskovia douganii]MBE7701395.1 phosphatase PAP2 family protein [Oerskovia douganii]
MNHDDEARDARGDVSTGESAPSGTGEVWRARLVAALPGLVLIVIGVLGFLVVYDSVREREDLWFADDVVLDWMVAHRTATATAVLTFITNIFGPVVLPIVVAAACLWWGLATRRWWEPGLLVGAMIASTLTSTLLKMLVARPRPDESDMVVAGVEHSFSFPSGHTIGAATLVLVGGYLVWRQWKEGRQRRLVFVLWVVVSVVVIVVVGGSRLYLGYHFVTDVLAGASLAVAVLGGVVVIDRLHDLARDRPRAIAAA